MKRSKITRLLSLALAFLLALTLVPLSARAEGDEVSGIATVADLTVKSARSDGHVKFGDASSIASVQADGKELGSMTVEAALARVCSDSLSGAELDYVSYVSVLAVQGTIYDGYTSEGDTGAGVAGVSRYYREGAEGGTNSVYHIADIYFVPNASFSGKAKISYFGYYHYTDSESGKLVNGSYSGVIYVTVGKQEPGISYATDGEPVRLLAEDFATYSRAVTGSAFRYVSFTVPSSDKGKMYYNYLSESVYDYEIESGRRFYRSTTPMLDKVYFLPAKDYEGSFQLAFSGEDTAGKTFSGKVVINVTAYGPSHPASQSGAFTYRVEAGRSVALKAEDFRQKCISELGSPLDYVRFTTLPSSGTLYDGTAWTRENYVAVNKTYFDPGSIRYVADAGYSGTVTVPFVGYGYNGKWFDGTIRFIVGESTQTPLSYKIDPGKRVYFLADDFSDASIAATGYDINRIHIESLPSPYDGTLYYDGNPVTQLRSYVDYYKEGLGRLSFLAAGDFDGTSTISFTGYATGYSDYRARTFRGTITVTSTKAAQAANTPAPIGAVSSVVPTSYTSGPAVPLDLNALFNAASSALPDAPKSFSLARPEEGAGRLCLDFVSLAGYTPFDSRADHPIADAGRVSFLPKAGFSGEATLSCTVKDAKGDSYTGSVRVIVTPPTRSLYFSDMGDCQWAVPAVDFFRHYGAATGNSGSGFGPHAEMRRGDFILLLSRAFGLPTAGGMPYDDVPPDKYYAAAIAGARSQGILTADDAVTVPNPDYLAAVAAVEAELRAREEALALDPRAKLGPAPRVDPSIPRTTLGFDPETAVTRQDAALYLYRALRQVRDVTPGSAADLAAFADADSTAPGAVEALGALVRLGVFTGDVGRLRPAKPLTRAETITILYRALT